MCVKYYTVCLYVAFRIQNSVEFPFLVLIYFLQVNKFEVEKTALQKDVSNLTSKLVDAKVTICDLEEENVSIYRNLSSNKGQ